MKKINVVFIVVVVMAICVLVWNKVIMRDSNSLITDWQKISIDYVSQTRGWAKDDYYLEYVGLEGGLHTVTVVYKEDVDNAVPGAGESFEIYIDLDNEKIVRELLLQ